MILKVAGLVAIFIACSAWGLFKSSGLSKRVRQLELFVGTLGLISTEIRYFASPTDVIVGKIDALGEYKELRVFGICKMKLPKLRDFSRAWEDALNEAKQYLSLADSDYEALLWFGKVLGTTDVEGEIANCEHYGALLRQRLELAREDKKKRGKMYSSLGVLTGLFFLVLFF